MKTQMSVITLVLFAGCATLAAQVPPPSTPDIVSFLAIDKTGKRIAYGTGEVTTGNIDVTATGN